MSVGSQMVVVLEAFVKRCVSLALGHSFEFSWLEVSQTDLFHWSSPHSGRVGGTGSRALRRIVHLVTTARVPRPQWPGCLLAFAGSLSRSRAEKNLSHLSRRPTGDGTLARPRQCLVQVSGFQYQKTAYVLLGLQVRPVGDEHLAIGLRPQRFRVAGTGEATSEHPDTGSLHLFVEHVDIAYRRFGHEGRIEIIGMVNSN